VALAQKVMAQYENTPMYGKLKSIFDKISGFLPDRVTVESGWLDSRFTMLFEKPPIIDDEIWNTLFAAVQSRTKVRIWYRNPGYEEALYRTVAPYHILCHDGQWYVIGDDSYSNEIRIFAVSRINSIRQTTQRFDVPEEFKLFDYIDSRLGVFIGEEQYTVELQFSPEVACYIKERTWHDNQKIEELDDGSLMLRFTTGQLMSVLFWVLRWAGNVKVLSPPKLVDLVKESLEEALRQYE
jgi:predicted DNA-binding transcriptional regulator YafY